MNKLATTLASAVLISSCGGGGGTGSGTTESGTPLENIPTSAHGIIELGPISGGTVTLIRPNGQTIGSVTTNSDGSIRLNPREIVSQIGNDAYIIARVSGGQDTDADDDGSRDSVPTPVNGEFRMIIMRSSLERGDSLIVNPRAGLVSEILLGRESPRIEQDILDHLTRETGALDQNNDGKIDYRDITSIQMKNAEGVSKVVPFVSGYIASVHAGNTQQKINALKNVARTESALIRSIVSHPSGNTHIPALKLQSTSAGSTILYTLDGSTPLVGGSTARSAQGEVTIPMQDTKLYYREQFQLNGETILGRVRSFDLISDWTELSQETLPYNPNGTPGNTTESLTYKNVPYTVTTLANQVNPAYTYPKTITCKVGSSKDAGCHYGPYMVWSPEHENKVRGLITLAVQAYVDTTSTNPTPPLEEKYRDDIPYNGAHYSMVDIWTRGIDGNRTFPVRIDVTIRWNNGKPNYTTTRTVNSQNELDRFHTELEKSIKEYIDSENKSPTPTYPRNHTISYTGGKIENYYGGWYELFNTYNLSGTANYPVQISGNYYVLGQGTKATTIVMAANDAERIQKSNQLVSEMQAAIQSGYNQIPPPQYPRNHLIDSGFVSYRNGYGYRTLTTMNITGTSDYPATVRVAYTTPLSNNNTTQTLTANNASELASIQAERVNEAKARIDQVLNADQYPPNHVETVTNTISYGGGVYRTTFTYSGNPGQDYPGYLDTYVTYRNGSSDKLTLQVDSANAKNTQALNLEAQARQQIDNYNPTYAPNTITSDGPHSYGNRGSNYTYKVMYNRVGNSTNYPALVWIEYNSGNTINPKDTRTTYGNMIANNSVEKEQIKATLLTFVKGQMVALGGVDIPMYTTAQKLHDLLPFPTAYAQSQNSILVKKSESQLPNFAPAGLGLMYGQFYGNSGTAYQHWVSNREKTTSVAGITKSDVDKKINNKVLEIFQKYSTTGTLYLGGELPEGVDAVIASIFIDIANKVTARDIYLKYQAQLISYGITVETLARMEGEILIVYSEGLIGAQETYPENYVFGAKALFGLGKIGIKMLVDRATGKILLQTISGPGAAEFIKYEARVTSGKVIFRDATGNVIRLEKGTNAWGFDHIFKRIVNAKTGEIRIMQIQNALNGNSQLVNIVGKSKLESFDDFEKFIQYIVKNGKQVPNSSNGIDFTINIGGRNFYMLANTDGRIITLYPN